MDLLSYFEYHEYELPETKICKIILKLSMAVYHLHSYGILNRKLTILYLNFNFIALIKIIKVKTRKYVNDGPFYTSWYSLIRFWVFVALEVLQRKPYDRYVDLWSVGIITFLLLCVYWQFDDKISEREIAKKAIKDFAAYNIKFGVN